MKRYKHTTIKGPPATGEEAHDIDRLREYHDAKALDTEAGDLVNQCKAQLKRAEAAKTFTAQRLTKAKKDIKAILGE